MAYVLLSDAEVGGVDEHRVDYQRPRGVVGGHREAHLLRFLQHIAAGDGGANTRRFLVDDGGGHTNVAARGGQHQLPCRVDLDAIGAPEEELEHAGVSTRGHHEVVLQLSLVAVVD